MRLILGEKGGFCFGVKSAVETARRLAGEHTYTYGDIIHNERVMDGLKAQGVKSVESIDDIVDETATVIIRSHGAKKEIYEQIEKRGFRLVDATCPFVKKIHEIVEQHYRDGYKIVIIGKADHPEVVGINGWCNDSALVIDENTDICKLELSEKTCFVAQTTFSTEKYSDILKKIRKHAPKTVEIFDTICYTTIGRQNEAIELAKICSKILVVGSKKSSNTQKLIELSNTDNCVSYGIAEVDDLRKINFSTEDIVGIIAGASAPDELITEVKEYMSDKMDEQKSFAELLNETMVEYKKGKTYSGTVIAADEKGITLNIGGKLDGFVPADQVNIDGSYNPADYVAGVVIDARMIDKDNDANRIVLSKKSIDELKEADKIVDTVRNGERFEIVIDKAVEKGLTSKLGRYNIFIPASQVEERFVRDLKKYQGKKLEVVVLQNENGEFEIDDNKHKIVASHRKVVETDRKAKEDVFWANVVPNMIVNGVVKRTTTFGAFVSVDGFDCLAHIVDLSWTHIKSVEEVLTVGEAYDFVVLSADREKNRVSLGYKQLQPHPFVACMEKHPVGSTCNGKVVSVVPFGVFVEIEPHIEGLVHVSEVAHSFVKNINEAVNVGDEVEVKVLNYDEQNRKINLSIKACLPEEEKPAAPEKAEGEVVEKKPRKRVKQEKTAPEGETEWSEDTSNNPFAALLKDLDVK